MPIRRPFRLQLLVPFVTVLCGALAIVAATEAWQAANRVERELIVQLTNVVTTIEQLSVNYTDAILTRMRGLSGAELVALGSEHQIVAATFPNSATIPPDVAAAPLMSPSIRLSDLPTVTIGSQSYIASRVRASGSARVHSLVVLYPEGRWREARWAAAWPPLLVGALTALATSAVAAVIANRLARRVHIIEQLFAAIAAGDFRQIQVTQPVDELDDLIVSANHLSRELSTLHQSMKQTERVRLLAQLAGGLAHQLRNAITGARMAVQIHQRRCRSSAETDDSLSVALTQLSLTEEHTKRLLALSRHRERQPVPASLLSIIEDVVRWVSPVCEHCHVDFKTSLENLSAERPLVADGESLRTALLNVVLNGIEAAGVDGQVTLETLVTGAGLMIRICDSGPGPSADIRDSLFDPFVTTKPEGVGLGLSQAKQAVDELGGSIRWRRDNGRTIFEFELPTSELTGSISE